MRVYKITFDVDDYRSLLAKDESVHEKSLLALDGSSRTDRWLEPLEVVIDNEEAPEPDIYSCGAGNMVLWGRSLEILRPLIGKVAELLPVFWEGGHGYLVNLVGLSDCLDSEHTKWYRDESSGKGLFIEQHVFIKERVPYLVPFKIKEQRFSLFCADAEDGSENMPEIIDTHGLKGVSFDSVWNS